MLTLPAPAAVALSLQLGPLLGACASLLVATLGAFAGTALLVYSPTKLHKRLARRPDLARRIAEREAELVLTARALALLGSGGTLLCAAEMSGSVPSWLAVAAAAAVILVGCGMLPPAIAATRAEAIVAKTWPLLSVFHLLLRFPVVLPLVSFARPTLRFFGVPSPQETDADEIADEIMAAVTDTDRSNALESAERTWIANIVDLKDLQVSVIMTPRTDIVALDGNATLAEAVACVVESGHSRYPVHAGKLDEIIGVFYAKDVLSAVRSGDQSLSRQRVRESMRKPVFVPETMGVIELLHQLQGSKVHMAIVLDEYGGTAGLVTIEDILEEIVGDIVDEYDPEEESALRVVEADREVEIAGRARVDEVNEHFVRAQLPEDDDYDTVAGYVFSRLGRIPPAGERLELDGFEITVLSGDDRRIGRLRLRVLEQHDAPVT